jgi:ring-1,2-phenylacetyl-CoA epoxidase subunit PaaD
VVTARSAREAAAAVVDPEIRVVTIEELGILRDVRVDGRTGRVTVTITPTYSGCPALDVIRADIVEAVRGAGYRDVAVETALAPAWSTAQISATGREKLAAAGIAPPGPAGRGPARSESGPVSLTISVRCPRCGSPETEQISRFGSTACKSLWRCRACTEPFDRIKPI